MKGEDYIKNIANAERRYLAEVVECREEDGKNYFEGYAAKFNKRTSLGWMTEEIAEGAFDNVMNDDTRGLFNHDPDVVLGRTTSGTMRLSVDGVGLKYQIDYNPEDPDHVRVMQKIKRGDVSQSSFAFSIADEKWEKKDGKDHRIITRLSKLYDVAPVTYPAYADTSVAARSFNEKQTPATGEVAELLKDLI